MHSLIVILAPVMQPGDELSYALSSSASPGLLEADADSVVEHALPEHGSALLALLPRADEVVAVVPARSLSWHRVVLPRVNSARLRIALDGLLEDRLLEEPQGLHFALAPGAMPGQTVWLAVCNRAWLHAALHAFEAAGRRVARVVPEHTPLPDGSPATLHVFGSSDDAWMVRRADDGVQTLPFEPAVFAALDLDGVAVQPTAEPAVSALAEEALERPVLVQHTAQGLVAAARSRWDLAQFDLTSTGGTRVARRLAQGWAQWAASAAWRPARWGLAALLLAHLFGLNAWAFKERSALQAKRAEIRNQLVQTFPKVALVVDAPVQMEREVAALRQATGAVSSLDLEPMLATVAENLSVARVPSAIEYASSELTLKGFQLPAAEANVLTQGLTAAGYASRVDGDSWVIRARAKAGLRADKLNVIGAQP